MEFCTDAGNPEGSCRCVIERMEETLPYEEYRDSNSTPPEADAAFRHCGLQLIR